MEIVEASQLPTDEKVYLKKDWMGWRVVYPLKKEDGTIDKFNLIFGSKANVVFLIIILLIGTALYFGVNELIGNYKEVAKNPCSFCEDCQIQCRNLINQIDFNRTINKSLVKIYLR